VCVCVCVCARARVLCLYLVTAVMLSIDLHIFRNLKFITVHIIRN
jgi:hypothetical protein